MDDLYRLDNRTALVTGSAQGIGKEIVLTLAGAGADVVVNDINEELAETTAEEVRSCGARSLAVVADITDSAAVNEMIKSVTAQFPSLDILVNNAGIARDGYIVRMSDEQWDTVLNINLKGAFNCIRAAARPMIRQRSGAVVNISSVVGVAGNISQVNYSASKAGLLGVTKSAAKELSSRGIRVNAVAPGFIQTAMTEALPEKIREKSLKDIPLNRYGTAREVANLVHFLASDASSYITGQVIHVDGGLIM